MQTISGRQEQGVPPFFDSLRPTLPRLEPHSPDVGMHIPIRAHVSGLWLTLADPIIDARINNTGRIFL